MAGLPKTFGNYCVTAAAMLAAGCSYTTQSAKLHTPFVPVAHGAVASAALPPAPETPAIKTVLPIPPIVHQTVEFSEERANAEMLVQQAYLRLQHGKGLY